MENTTMMPDGLGDSDIAAILTLPRRIALVGASANPARPSYGVMSFLLGRGFDVVPVNPGLAGGQLLGQEVFGRLADVPGRIDMVDVFRRSEEIGAVVDDALARPERPRVLWLQLGLWDADAAARARAGGLTVVIDRCPAIEIPRLRLH